MPSILDGAGSIANSLLNSARKFAPRGIGLSANARILNEQFISSTQSTFNQIFSLGGGPGLTVEGAQTQILGLRAKTPESQLAPSLRGQAVDKKA